MKSVIQVSKEHHGHNINPRAIGIFFEDINFSCDGGINANVVNNYSFDGVYFSADTQERVEDPLRYWEITGGTMESRNECGLHENSKYAAICTNAEAESIADITAGNRIRPRMPSVLKPKNAICLRRRWMDPALKVLSRCPLKIKMEMC